MAAYAIQFRRGTTLEHSAFTGEIGEVTVDTDKNTIVVHDGSTPGGHPLALYSDLSGAPSSGSSGGSTGGASTTVSDTAPTSPSAGDFWYNSSTLGLFIYYNDGNSSQWVQVSGGVSTGETVITSDTAPTGVDSGDFWLDSTNLDLYVYYVDSNGTGQWIQVSAAAGTTAIGTGDTTVSTSDTGTDGKISFTTENTLRWDIDSSGHIIPNGNALYDIGNAENKVRHFYLSPNSLTIGDTLFSESNVDRSMEVYTDQPAPSSSTDTGTKGDVRIVGNYMYVCTETNIWVRSSLDTSW